MKKRILHLTLKKIYFDQIALRKKIEEYRAFKPYWIKRFLKDQVDNWDDCCIKQFDEIYFRNGYRKDSPFMRVEWKGLELLEQAGDKKFVILLGKILEIKNWKKEDDVNGRKRVF